MQQVVHGQTLARPVGIGRIEHVHQQIRFAQFFERGAKRRHQILGKIGDESNGIGQADVAAGRDVHAPNGRIEGGKRLIGHEDVAARERVE